MKNFGLYLRALIQQWVLWITGSVLTAALFVYGAVEGSAAAERLGVAFLVVTFILAGFGAWEKEKKRADDLVHRSAEQLPSVTIAHLDFPNEGHKGLRLTAQIRNPSNEATSFSDDWILSARDGGGVEILNIRGQLVGGNGFIRQGDTNHVMILFYSLETAADVPPEVLRDDVRFEVTTKDIKGRPVSAVYP